jgi:hypothetical protein
LVRSVVVVLLTPVVDQELGFVEAVEALEIEQFAAKVAVERFDVGILPGAPSWM